jgi:nucleoside-diphosphate-sugar epimerase
VSHIVIAGVGYVGTCLAEGLTLAGHTVYGLRRSSGAGGALPYQPLVADLTDSGALHGVLPTATTHIVFAAGPSTSSDEAYRDLFVHGLANLLAAARELPQLSRIVLVSSTSVFAQTGAEWVNESSSAQPEHWSGRRVLEAEGLLAQAPCSATRLRCAGIYGPGRTRLIDSVRSGRASYDPERPVYMNRIHRDDVAGALQHLLFLEQVAPLYLGVDTYPSPDGEVLEWLAGRLNAPAPTQARSAATDEGGRRGGSNKRCSSERLQATGFKFRFPTFREGYGAMLASANP